jgi:hypothetical protein
VRSGSQTGGDSLLSEVLPAAIVALDGVKEATCLHVRIARFPLV